MTSPLTRILTDQPIIDRRAIKLTNRRCPDVIILLKRFVHEKIHSVRLPRNHTFVSGTTSQIFSYGLSMCHILFMLLKNKI